ncbi:hypothetical protein Tco_0728772 [Tanacetum coccineum]|uniref:Integrase, catalytic region, zinc finger, CCHC-type, peptidase aspartic, catalytic n=1 Tax=Tanacetum coccineum TaxID=301880 RepID=A0ABQ4YN67_9ASTR
MDSIIPIGQKNTLVEYMILFGAGNRPPMLDKDLYDSWKSRLKLYMQNREHGRRIFESVKHGPLICPTIEENGVTRTNKYVELSTTKKIQADRDPKVTNIILQGLPSDIYSLVNHHRVAKDLWEKVQLLMQVNTKFLNSLPPEWSKFVTDVKLVKDLHTTTFDQLHAYLKQHELHANKVRLMRERSQDPLVLVSNHQMTPSHFNTYQSSYKNPKFQQQQQFSPSQSPQYGSNHSTQHYSTTYPSTPHAITYPSAPYPNAYSLTVHQAACPQPQSVPQIEYTVFTVNQQTHLAEFPLIDSSLAVPVFKQGDDPIDAINKMMSFLEGHIARQCPKPKRKRDATLFREKVLLVEAQGNGKVLNEKELEFLANPGIAEGPVTQSVITHNATYQADDLDAYDSDCDEISTAKAVLMANVSSYESDVLSKVPISNNTNNYMLNQSVQEMPYSEPSHFVEHPENEIHSDSNIIPYSQYLIESQNAAVQDTNSSAQQDAFILSVFEQLSNQVTKCNKVNNDNLIANESLFAELEKYKERVKLLEERQNVDLVLYDNNLKQALGFQNPFYLKKAQQIRPMLYDGNVIAKENNVISIADSEETLMLEEESRSKMLLKQNDPMVLEKKFSDVGLERVEAKGGRPISRHRFSSSSLGKLVLVEICGGKEEDVGLDELGEGGKEVVSKIGDFGGDIGSELLGDKGGEVLFGGGEGGRL